MGLYTPTILGGNSYLSWFYDRGAIKDPAHTGTSKGLSRAINRGPIRKFLPKYANVYVTIQSHGLSAGVRTHYVTANGVRDGLGDMGRIKGEKRDVYGNKSYYFLLLIYPFVILCSFNLLIQYLEQDTFVSHSFLVVKRRQNFF